MAEKSEGSNSDSRPAGFSEIIVESRSRAFRPCHISPTPPTCLAGELGVPSGDANGAHREPFRRGGITPHRASRSTFHREYL